EAEEGSPLVELGMESLRLYPGFVAEVRRETGIDPLLDRDGILQLDLTREDAADSQRLRRWQREAGLPVETVSPRDLESLEPALSGTILGGLYFPGAGRVEPGRLTRAL